MLSTFYLDPKESDQVVENGPPMTPLMKFQNLVLCSINFTAVWCKNTFQHRIFIKMETKSQCCANYIESNSSFQSPKKPTFLSRDDYCFVCF